MPLSAEEPQRRIEGYMSIILKILLTVGGLAVCWGVFVFLIVFLASRGWFPFAGGTLAPWERRVLEDVVRKEVEKIDASDQQS